jgi:hypothetical protein
MGGTYPYQYLAVTTADQMPTLPGMGPQLKCYYTAPGKEKLSADLSTLMLASAFTCPQSMPGAAPDQIFCDSCGRCAKVPIIGECHPYFIRSCCCAALPHRAACNCTDQLCWGARLAISRAQLRGS